MNRFVVDASIAAAWFFEDESSDTADATLNLLKAGADVVAPVILWFELHNAILLGVRRKRLLETNAAALLLEISRTKIRYDPSPASGARVFALALKHRLTFYDAAYLELAQRQGCALATLDRALETAARAENVALVGAA